MDARVAEEVRLRQDRERLPRWEALIASAAQAEGCRYLLSENFQDHQSLGDVRVVNPFGARPEILDDIQ